MSAKRKIRAVGLLAATLLAAAGLGRFGAPSRGGRVVRAAPAPPAERAREAPAAACAARCAAVVSEEAAPETCAPAESLPLAEIPGALQALQRQPDTPDRRERMLGLARAWAESDPAAAARWAEALPADETRSEVLNGVAIVWASQNAQDALFWSSQLPDEAERNRTLKSVAYEAARTDAVLALAVALEYPQAGGKPLMEHAVLQWAAVAPEEAACWALQVEELALRDRLLSCIATAWSEQDPVAAAQLAVLEIAPGRAQDDAVIGIVQRWRQQDPAAVSRWVAAFPASALGDNALQVLAGP